MIWFKFGPANKCCQQVLTSWYCSATEAKQSRVRAVCRSVGENLLLLTSSRGCGDLVDLRREHFAARRPICSMTEHVQAIHPESFDKAIHIRNISCPELRELRAATGSTTVLIVTVTGWRNPIGVNGEVSLSPGKVSNSRGSH